MEYSSNAKGNLGVTLGAIGTGLGALNNGMGLLSGLGGGYNTNSSNCGNQYVNRETFDVQLQLIEEKKENAILAADLASEKKMVEVFNAANDKINNVRDELRAEIRNVDDKVDANAAAQGVLNAQMGSTLNLATSQIAQLYSLTQLKIPNANVCPGWGDVRISATGCSCTGGSGGTTTS